MSIVLDYSGSMFGGNNIYTMQYAANGLMKTVKGAHYTRVNFDGMIDQSTPHQLSNLLIHCMTIKINMEEALPYTEELLKR